MTFGVIAFLFGSEYGINFFQNNTAWMDRCRCNICRSYLLDS